MSDLHATGSRAANQPPCCPRCPHPGACVACRYGWNPHTEQYATPDCAAEDTQLAVATAAGRLDLDNAVTLCREHHIARHRRGGDAHE